MPNKFEPDTIWKYQLEMVDEQTIATPHSWRPIHVDMQDGILSLWAEVDSEDGGVINRTIAVYGTGHPIRDKHWQWQHLGSTLAAGGALVWHVYWKELGHGG